jgi:hypothetical protein
MRHKDLGEATRRAAQKRSRSQPPLDKAERGAAKRMATVAAVYTVDRNERTADQIVRSFHPIGDADRDEPRPKPEAKRVWASLEREPRQVVREAFEEAARRDPSRRKQWVAVVDGNKPESRLRTLTVATAAAGENRSLS